MNFLAPLFLAGATLIALPILFHLIRRTSKKTVQFSSLRFLNPTPPKVTRRSRIEQWLLLALRCLIFILLALAFSRPFWRQFTPPAAARNQQKQTVILVDTSASMRRQGVWNKALESARSHLEKIPIHEQVSLCTYDNFFRVITPFGRGRGEVLSALNSLKPSWFSGDLGRGLSEAAELLEGEERAEQQGLAKEIILISDLQASSKTDTLQGFTWPQHLTVRVESIEPASTGNAWLQWNARTGGALNETNPVVSVRVINAASSKNDRLALQWKTGEKVLKNEVYVPPGQSRVVPLSLNKEALSAQVTLAGDSENFDNELAIQVPAPATRRIIYLGEAITNNPAHLYFFIDRAFGKVGRDHYLLENATAASLSKALEGDASFLLITRSLSSAEASAVQAWLQKGKIALVALPANEQNLLGSLLGRQVAVREAAVEKDYLLLSDIDFAHPVFLPFANPKFSDFSKIHVWKAREVTTNNLPGCRIVARFDNKTPALLQVPVGTGSLLVLTTTWAPADSQLALSSKFVPLLYSCIQLSEEKDLGISSHFVGQTIRFPESISKITLPDRTEKSLGQEARFIPEIPGVYTAIANGKPRTFTVNLLPEESRPEVMSADDLARLGVPMKSEIPVESQKKREAQLLAAEQESRQKLWRWLILGALTLLLVEAVIAQPPKPSRLARA